MTILLNFQISCPMSSLPSPSSFRWTLNSTSASASTASGEAGNATSKVTVLKTDPSAGVHIRRFGGDTSVLSWAMQHPPSSGQANGASR